MSGHRESNAEGLSFHRKWRSSRCLGASPWCCFWHLHRPLCDQGQKEIHVINKVLEAGVRQVLGLISSSCCLVTIDVNNPILHLDVVSQVLRETPSFKGILSILHWRGEHCTKGGMLWGRGCQQNPTSLPCSSTPSRGQAQPQHQQQGVLGRQSPHGALRNSCLTPHHPNLK